MTALDPALLRIAADPETEPGTLRATLRFVETMTGNDEFADLRRAVLRNPNLPQDELNRFLTDGDLDAWMNPAVPLRLVEAPMVPDGSLERGLCLAACEAADEWWSGRRSDAYLHVQTRGPGLFDGQRGEFWDQWRDHLRRIADREQTPHLDEAG